MDAILEPLSYELLSEVGQGSHGKVYKARELGENPRYLAVKKFDLRGYDIDRGVPAFIIREVAMLRRMKQFNHPNIVQLLDATVDQADKNLGLTLVLEFIDQDLSTYLSKAPASGLRLECIKNLMLQLLQGLDFLHMNLVLHRDLKPENVLVSSRGEVKIADFGLARIYTFNNALTPGVVTLWYRAPEVLLNSVYMSSVDMWSAGCIFAELFLLKPLFRAFTDVQQLQKIFELIGLPAEEDWPTDSPFSYRFNWGGNVSCELQLRELGPLENDLLAKCLIFRPTRRISAAEALAHPFFTQ